MEHIDRITADSFRGFVEAVRYTLSDVWAEYRKPFIGFSLVMMLLSVVPYAVSGVGALLINYLVDERGLSTWTTGIFSSVVALGFLFYVREGLGTFSNYLERRSWKKIRSDYELRLSRKLVSLDMATHEDAKFNDKLTVVQENGGSYSVANFIFMLVGNIGTLTSVVVASVAIFAADWLIFLAVLAGSIPRLWVEIKHGEGVWSIHQASAEQRREYQEFRRHTQQNNSIRDIQASQAGEFFLGRQYKLLSEFLRLEQGRDNVRFLRLMLSHTLTISALVFGLVLLVGQVVDGKMQIGTYTFFMGAMISFQGAIQGFFLAFAEQHRMAKTVLALFEIFDKSPVVVSPENGRKLSLTKSPRIEFRDVSFAYPTKPDNLVLKNFSLVIEPGERIAIVGLNGAGKSTLIKLLCRLYDPIAGQILVDGIDLREVFLPSWYGNLALLAQDYSSYRFKAWEVVALGRINGSRNQEKIERAARRARASEFIEKWEKGYDQQLGAMFTDGVEVSGGQRQRLALARTFYRDALVSILDEPAAHLDPAAERDLFDVMEDETRPEQILVLITHRLSTVRGVDKICVIKNGSVHEIGSHKELMRANGTYAELFEKQAEGYR